jgi:hypothetical protein
VTTLFSHRYRSIVRFLALALLVSQLGAEIHAYSHVAGDPGAPIALDQCARCLQSIPLTAAVGGATLLIDLRAWASERIVPGRAASIVPARPALPFRARAPPSLVQANV